MIREVIQSNDQETDPIDLPGGTLEAIVPLLRYVGTYPSLMKKFVHPYLRLLMHMFMLCMTENSGGTDQLSITQSTAFVCLITNQPFNYSRYIFEGMKRNVIGVRKYKFIMYLRFLQMIFNARYPELERSGNTLDLKPMGPSCFGALTSKKEDVTAEQVIVQPEPVNITPANAPVNAMIVEDHVVQGATKEEPETEILTIYSNDEGIEISCDDDDDDDDEVELPPEAEASFVVSTVQPVISSKSLALLLKSITEKMGNPPSDPSVQNEEQTTKDPKDPDTQQMKRKRRDPLPGMYIEQNKDQPTTNADDEYGLYDLILRKTQLLPPLIQKYIPVATIVSTLITESTLPVVVAIASSSGTTHDEPCSSSGKRPEEPVRMSFVDDLSDDEFISMREMKKRIVVLEQDSIHKDAKIIQLEDTIVQKNQQIDQLQGDVSLLFNMVYDLRGKLGMRFGNEFSDPTDTENQRKAEQDRARAFANDDADRATAMDQYFKRVTDKDAEKSKAERLKKKKE
ncbi:hypothetical protein Hanom_Chr17g01583271 [Helianthus anomalus]